MSIILRKLFLRPTRSLLKPFNPKTSMGKLSLIIKREYLAKVRNKSFVVMTFLSPILMVGVGGLIVNRTKINGNEIRTICVLDESHYFSADFQGAESTSFVKLKGIGLEAANDSIQKMGFYGLLFIPNEQ